MNSETSFKYKNDSELLSQIERLESKLNNNEKLIKLSEEIVHLKREELDTESKLRSEKQSELEARLGRLERRVDSIEVRMGELEERTRDGLEEIRKKQELAIKQEEISDFMAKKFEIIQKSIERSENQIMEVFEKRFEEANFDNSEKFRKVENNSEEIKYLIKEALAKSNANAEELEVIQNEIKKVMKTLDEQSIQIQDIKQVHDELMVIKQRELQIVNMLKNQGNSKIDLSTIPIQPQTST